MTSKTRILIVDDDPNIRDVIGFAVEAAGFETRFAEDGAAGLQAAQSNSFDLVVLDIGLPEMDGLEVCKTLRKSSDVPILFLTARDDEVDRIVGMEIGGDDYVTKPFSPRELVARIKAILKRTQRAAAPDGALTRGDLSLDLDRHQCRVAGRDVALTASEVTLLAELMRRGDHVAPRQALIDAVYGSNIHVSDRTIDSHIRNIRSKLLAAGCADSILTVHGVGLRMGPCRA
ncbi:response regulator transcription factor [Gymnodinialimonas sp. 2305UL16-5]|uniref:response regulator transcription factor n=1 Tax=Gymnodinialimonas mytili TaxID=3126503 RepID=UPI00309CE1CC